MLHRTKRHYIVATRTLSNRTPRHSALCLKTAKAFRQSSESTDNIAGRQSFLLIRKCGLGG